MKNLISPNYKTRTIAGFTLMELLVVIVVIGILAGFLFPAATGVMRRAKRVKAENTAQNLKASISAYYTEYRKYPVDTGGSTDDKELLSDNELMDVLLAADSEAESGGLNPRKIVFFSGNAAKPMAGGKHRDGVLLSTGGAGELFDPWGENYGVKLDTDYNGRVTPPSWSSDTNEIPTSIIVWSSGADADETAEKDNVETW